MRERTRTRARAHTHTHTHTHIHHNTHTQKQQQQKNKKTKQNKKTGLPTQDELRRRILAVPGRRIVDQDRDVSRARIFWGSSRHHGCETEVVPVASSLLLLLAPGQSSLFSAGKVCRPRSLAKLRSTLDTGHARRQQLNCSLTWKRQSSGKKPPRDRCVGAVSSLRSRAGKTELTAVTDQQTELTLLVSR